MDPDKEAKEKEVTHITNSENPAQQTKKELFSILDKLRKDINSCRKELNEISDEKESNFDKKEGISADIRNKIEDIKSNRKKRDELTAKVKELKEKRHDLNEEIKKQISELVEIKEQTNNLTKKSKVKDPYKLKGEIDRIEIKLETEPMSFDKEKDLSKKLKQLKKFLNDSSEILVNFDKIRKYNAEINNKRKSSFETHNEIQKLASESQKLHESIIASSKEIDDLKAKAEDTFKNYSIQKNRIKEINDRLNQKLEEMGKIKEKIDKFKLEEDEKRKLKEMMIIKNKELEIEEKIKGGKKLTTEDFLLFQEIFKKKENQ